MTEFPATLIPSNDKLYKHFKGFTQAYLIEPNQWCYPKNGPRVVNNFQHFKVREDDICLVTFPKTGTTWMQEIVYLLLNNLDFKKAKSVNRNIVFPYADANVWEFPFPDTIEFINKLPSPRPIKYHLNYSHLPPDVTKQCKIIYVCRNVKDTIISCYYFNRAMASARFEGDIEDFAELFMDNKVPYAPYIAHVKDFWNRRNEKNIFFTTYEDLQKDQEKVIARVAEFLNVSISDEEIKLVAEHCKFDSMKKQQEAYSSDFSKMLCRKDFEFMRKGTVGNWHDEMSPELIAKIDKWTHEQTIDTPALREIL